MSHQLNLASIDVDGAVRETAAEAMDALDGDTRSQFLRRAGIAGGAVIGGGALLGALAPSAMAFEHRGPPAGQVRQGRHRHPQLRADARVPRVRRSTTRRPPTSGATRSSRPRRACS